MASSEVLRKNTANTNETFSGNANTLVLLQMQRTLVVLLRAFHSAVHEKADMEMIPLDAAAYRIYIIHHIQ
jgi:hypothetical protein